jgi:Flp pilus assembly secretin CpaC
MKPTSNHFLVLTVGVLLVLACAVLCPGIARAQQLVTVTLKAGEAYEIKNVDSNSAPAVNFTDNSNCFTVKSTGAHSLTIFSFQPGEGSIQAKVGGEDVTYHVVVSGVANVANPLKPATGAPPVLTGAGKAETPVPAPYAPASAAVVNPPATATAETAAAVPSGSSGTPPGGGVAASMPDSGTGPVAMGAAPESPSAGEGGGTKTVVVGPTAFSGTDGEDYANGVTSSDGSTHETSSSLSPNVTTSPASQWHEQPPAILSQQFTTNPRALGPESYVNHVAFGGRHNLPPGTISITSGTSQVYDFGEPISRVSISNSSTVDVQVLGNHQLMLVGHQPGFSSLVLWDRQGNYLERQIWTEIAGHQEVMLHAIVAEVDLSKLEQMGVNISVALTKYGFTGLSFPGYVATPFTANGGAGPISMLPGGTDMPLLNSQNMTYAVSGQNSNVSTYAFFQFLEQHNLARILARPQLLANSGQKAKFLDGGEIPIVITQALTTTIVFKQYGTSVIFIPTVIGGGEIDLAVRPEVSQPDYSQGVSLFGFTVPAFLTRRAETRVRLRDNQTLIIAGLILDTSKSQVQKVPYLGDIPYLGSLFRQTYWQHDKDELVMSVTPEIVRPLPQGAEVALPTQRQGPMTPEEVRTKSLTTPDASRPRF